MPLSGEDGNGAKSKSCPRSSSAAFGRGLEGERGDAISLESGRGACKGACMCRWRDDHALVGGGDCHRSSATKTSPGVASATENVNESGG